MDPVVHEAGQRQGWIAPAYLSPPPPPAHWGSPLLQGDNWNDLLKKVITFDSVEEFWGIYVSCRPRRPFHARCLGAYAMCLLLQNNIAPVSDLALKSDYHLFKEGRAARVGGHEESSTAASGRTRSKTSAA